jgi:hypothetical protein
MKAAKEDEEHRLAAARDELPLPFLAILSKMPSNHRELVLYALDGIATFAKDAVGKQCVRR